METDKKNLKEWRQEIYARGEILRWMALMGWELEIVDEIMYFDNPSPEDVRRLVYLHGPDEALKIIKRIVQ